MAPPIPTVTFGGTAPATLRPGTASFQPPWMRGVLPIAPFQAAPAFGAALVTPPMMWSPPPQVLSPGQEVFFAAGSTGAPPAGISPPPGGGGAGGADAPGGAGNSRGFNGEYTYHFIPTAPDGFLEVRISEGKPVVTPMASMPSDIGSSPPTYLSWHTAQDGTVIYRRVVSDWDTGYPFNFNMSSTHSDPRYSRYYGVERTMLAGGDAWLMISPDGALAIDTSFSVESGPSGTQLKTHSLSGTVYIKVGREVELLPAPASAAHRQQLEETHTHITWGPSFDNETLFKRTFGDSMMTMTSTSDQVFSGSPALVQVEQNTAQGTLTFGPPSLEVMDIDGHFGRGVGITARRDRVTLHAYLDARHQLALSAYPSSLSEAPRALIRGVMGDESRMWNVGRSGFFSQGSSPHVVTIQGTEFSASVFESGHLSIGSVMEASFQHRSPSDTSDYVVQRTPHPIHAVPGGRGDLKFRTGLHAAGTDAFGIRQADGGAWEILGSDDKIVPVGGIVRAGRHGYSLEVDGNDHLHIVPRPIVFAEGTVPAISLNRQSVIVVTNGPRQGLFQDSAGQWRYALNERHWYAPWTWGRGVMGEVEHLGSGGLQKIGRLTVSTSVPGDPEDGVRFRAGKETLLFTP